MRRIAQALDINPKINLMSPVSVYTLKDFIKGNTPLGVITEGRNGQWSLTVSPDKSLPFPINRVIIE